VPAGGRGEPAIDKPTSRKPSKEEIRAAEGKTVADVITPGLRVLFCGINPGLYSGAVGHHFARPGNRFWPALHAAGFTERQLRPAEERELLAEGYGITNLVERSTAGAADLTAGELAQGGRRLEDKVRRYRPACVAVLGVEAYRRAFGRRLVGLGEQPDTLAGARLWVLPNPSGLNAHYQLDDLARLYREMRLAVETV
jgi:TDG/mug DNA glycosylase family protein